MGHVRNVLRVESHNPAERLIEKKLIGSDVEQVNCRENLLDNCQIGERAIRKGLQPLAKQAAAAALKEDSRDGSPAKLARNFLNKKVLL